MSPESNGGSLVAPLRQTSSRICLFFFFFPLSDTSTGAEGLRGARAIPPPHLSGFRVQHLFCQSTITPADVSLSKTQTEARRRLNGGSHFNKCATSAAFLPAQRQGGRPEVGTHYQDTIPPPRDTQRKPVVLVRVTREQQRRAHARQRGTVRMQHRRRQVAQRRRRVAPFSKSFRHAGAFSDLALSLEALFASLFPSPESFLDAAFIIYRICGRKKLMLRLHFLTIC